MPASAGNIILAGDVGAMLNSASFLNAANAAPLTTTANTDAEIVAGAFTFISGYAYEVSWFFRFQMVGAAGSNVRGCIVRFHRASSTGTLLHSSGYVGSDTAAAPGPDKMHAGAFVLKRTGATTTQTLSMCTQFSTFAASGTVTGLNVLAGATSPARFTVRTIGLAGDHADALEVPTA